MSVFNLLNEDRGKTHASNMQHRLAVSTRPQVFHTQPYIIMQICDSDLLFFFLLSGTLMRVCIDGSSGKRYFISNGQTNSDVTACQNVEMSFKSNNNSDTRKWRICLTGCCDN